MYSELYNNFSNNCSIIIHLGIKAFHQLNVFLRPLYKQYWSSEIGIYSAMSSLADRPFWLIHPLFPVKIPF